jgi:DNA-binding XRE family transcriptional regulator
MFSSFRQAASGRRILVDWRAWGVAGSTFFAQDKRYPLNARQSTVFVNRGRISLTPEQSRAARGLLDWSQTKLATQSNLSESTIRDFEKGRRQPSINNLAAIRATLEKAGVIFVDKNGEGPGVRLRKAEKSV